MFCLSFCFSRAHPYFRAAALRCLVDCSPDFYFFPFHVHPTDSAHSLHPLGVAHQTSLRSLLTMMSSSNSPPLGEAGRLFRDPITAAQDHVLKQAFPHGHHHSSVATVHDDRIPCNQSGHAAGSRVGSPAFVRLLLLPSPDPSAPACAGKNAATGHPCEPHAPPLRTTENEVADSLVCSIAPVVAALHWSVRWGSVPHSWLLPFHPRTAGAHLERFPSPGL